MLAGPVEATALGNLLTQIRADGEVGSLAEMRAVVRRSTEVKTFKPNAGSNWDAAARKFQAFRG